MLPESILNSIKKFLGPDELDTHFDPDIMMHTNSALNVLTQIGIGPEEGYFITGPDETWEDFMGDDKRFHSAKTYVFLKVKLVFDPPQSAAYLTAMQKEADEIIWRLNVTSDNKIRKEK